MSKFDQEDILTTYAAITKEAADWVDVAQSLGIDALIGGAIGAGGAALVGGGASSVLSGALIGIGVPLVGATPIGWVVGGALLAGSVGLTIYQTLKHTDDNIDDLIDRLNALDPNENYQGQVDKYINDLKQMKSAGLFAVPALSSNPTQRASQLAQRINNLEHYSEYIKNLQSNWTDIKKNLTDWGVDAQQAEVAINKSVAAIEKQIEEIKLAANVEAQKILKEISAKSGIDYIALAKDILSLGARLESIYGADKIEYDERERQILGFAKSITEGKYDTSAIARYSGLLVSFKNMLQQAFVASQKASKKPANLQIRHLSKRALKTPDGSFSMKGVPKAKEEPGQTFQRPKRDPNVISIQNSLNSLKAKHQLGFANLIVDGVYGDNTKNALLAVLDKYEGVPPIAGLSADQLSDISFMRTSPKLAEIARILASTVAKATAST